MRLGALLDACSASLQAVAAIGGEGGCVAVDARGTVAMPFNSAGMFRGVVGCDGVPRVAMYGDDELQPVGC